MFKNWLKILKNHLKLNYCSFIPPGVNIGNGVFIGRRVFLDSRVYGSLISIGNDTVITRGVSILTHDAARNVQTGINVYKPVIIGNRVYIGVNSTIMPGVTIGDDVVIAAGSVVTKSVNCGYVVGGVPAKNITTTVELDKKRIEMKIMQDKKFNYRNSKISISNILNNIEVCGYWIKEMDRKR